MNFTNLATDAQRLILHLTPATLRTCAVAKVFATELKRRQDKARLQLQRWYRCYRLTEPFPPDAVTRRTLLRYYITKYRSEWLERFPRQAIDKLVYLQLLPESVIVEAEPFCKPATGNLTSRFRAFCEAHMTMNGFHYYGW